MAVAESKTHARIELVLQSDETFSDDLGIFGHGVGPRLGAFKQSQAQIEDYCIRRLLIAWHKERHLDFPVVVKGTYQEVPDYLILTGEKREVIGVEVTAAGSEGWNKWLAQTEESDAEVHLLPGDGYPGDAPEQMAASDIWSAFERKAKSWERKRLLKADRYDLLIHENTEGVVLADSSRVIELVRRRIMKRGGTHPFARLHVISEPQVLSNLGTNDEQVCDLSQEYDYDFVAWLEGQAAAAQNGRRDTLDLPHIAEELRSMGASDRRALASYLRNLLLHLLNWKHQPRKRSRSWQSSVDTARNEIELLLNDSPSLAAPSYLEQVLATQYPRARRLAAKETGLALGRFPEHLPYSLEELLDPEFLPNGKSSNEGARE